MLLLTKFKLTLLPTEGGGDGGVPQRGHGEVHPAADAEEQHQAGGQGWQPTMPYEQMVFVLTGDLLWTTSGHVRQPLLPTG